KTNDDKTLSVNPKKTLTLKRSGVEQSTVRQNFSHGRTKAVVVETKKRKFARPDEKPEAEVTAAPPAATPAPASAPAPTPAPAAAAPAAPKPKAPAAPTASAAPAPTAPRPHVAPQNQRAAQRSNTQQAQRPRSGDRSGMVLNTLSRSEMDARRRALEEAR